MGDLSSHLDLETEHNYQRVLKRPTATGQNRCYFRVRFRMAPNGAPWEVLLKSSHISYRILERLWN